ncbi:putative bifunctional diguanylate cyclase/phosphodiesterase [Sphingomonas sp. ac-8]|uniref:putative bifunctional diguanylate cyclase/phosphodiesterase n=1 Tax=Sphingomonas sp. ac-8 TaxID=3242977 RepID=UPI003A7FF4E4
MPPQPPFDDPVDAARSTGARPPSETPLLAVGGVAALVLVALGSTMLAALLGHWLGEGPAPHGELLAALLLDIALLLLVWRRHLALREVKREHAAAEHRAQLLATRDPLAGVLDRKTFAAEGAELLARVDRRRESVALLLLDLDHFKAINDMHGQAVGDAVLRLVATAMLETMPPTALVARTGGDAFACAMIADPHDPETIDQLAERLLARVAQPVEAGGVRCQVSGSIGMARSGPEGTTIKALVRAADIALYSAKRSGRDRAAWFDRSMESELHSRNDVEEALRIAIPHGQIVPFFEQQVDLATGDLVGFEVVPRWQHPVRGLLDPESFLPVADETGLLPELSLSLMRQAFDAARDWDPGLRLAINLSPCQLRDAWLAQKILKLLTETGFPAHRLEVEVTEGALFNNLPLAQSIIGSLKNQGTSVALDEFGTGYSSLSHLRALPLDRIKIDRSVVGSIGDSADSAAIVHAIARLGESLNLPVTAQGVGDAAAETRLRGLGCARGQGLRYGPALSTAAARQMLAERRLLVGRPTPDPTSPPTLTSRRLAG